jgi:hypothetical protein
MARGREPDFPGSVRVASRARGEGALVGCIPSPLLVFRGTWRRGFKNRRHVATGLTPRVAELGAAGKCHKYCIDCYSEGCICKIHSTSHGSRT